MPRLEIWTEEMIIAVIIITVISELKVGQHGPLCLCGHDPSLQMNLFNFVPAKGASDWHEDDWRNMLFHRLCEYYL